MKVKMENLLKTQYPILREKLKVLGLSAYETSAYLALYALGREASVEEIFDMTAKINPIPRTKIHYVLKQLQNKELVTKTGYPYRFSLKPLPESLERLYQECLNRLQEENRRMKTEIDNSYRDSLSALMRVGRERIWEIPKVEDAKVITANLWSKAEREILLMTEVGEWILTSEELKGILTQRKKEKGENLKIYTLVSSLPEREQIRKEFEEFLTNLGATIYHYQPHAFRINIVDEKEALLIMQPKNGEERIYYAPSEIIAKSLKNLFILESLLSDDFREILLERLDKIDLPASMKDLLAFLKEF
jgi:sugar-specific transcriptional regulator TrmB